MTYRWVRAIIYFYLHLDERDGTSDMPKTVLLRAA
jgi:hypothetical protein